MNTSKLIVSYNIMQSLLTVELQLLEVLERFGQLLDVLSGLFKSGSRHDGGSLLVVWGLGIWCGR